MARNTLFLYFRMLVLLLVGLFTARVVLQTLGDFDYGIYQTVAGVVTMFTVVSNAVAAAIGRFITSELGRGDTEKLGRVFATSVVIQLLFCGVLFILVETLGVWYLNGNLIKLGIPSARASAANWVLQCAMLQLMLTLLSVPFNATIMAHESMKAYAYISLLEAFLKLSVALLLFFSGFDKLKTYAALMVLVTLIVRFTYSAYCHRHYEESRSRLVFDRELTREMLGFAGWNSFSSGVFVFNTQGINQLTAFFFGARMNAPRGVAAQVENIVKQFVFNVVNAINPQITKSYVSGNRDYSYTLMGKASKYASLIVLFFLVPVLYEADTFLEIWLKDVPDFAAMFTRLSMFCVLLDVMMSPCSTLVLADGRIKWFYIITSSISVLMFPAVWIAFRAGAGAQASYWVFIAVYLMLDVVKLVLLHRVTGYGYRMFFSDVLFRILPPAAVTLLVTASVPLLIPEAVWWRAFVTFGVSTLTLAASTFLFSLTAGEKNYILSKLSRSGRYA